MENSKREEDERESERREKMEKLVQHVLLRISLGIVDLQSLTRTRKVLEEVVEEEEERYGRRGGLEHSTLVVFRLVVYELLKACHPGANM